MPYTIDWFNEDQDILVVKYTGRWTWDEVREVDAVARNLYIQAGRRVDCIVDMKANAWVPPNYVANVNDISAEGYTNLHLMIFLTHNMLRELISAYNSQFRPLPYAFEFADTMEEAFERILRSRGQT